MKRLFARELRRLLPVGLAMLGLGVLIQLTAFLLPPTAMVVETGLWVVGLATPWLLGVAAFAPDYESGGEAFLSTLPVHRGALLGTRLGVAAAYTLAVLVTFGVFLTVAVGRLPGGDDMAWERMSQISALSLFPLLAGSLASIALRRSLVAFVTAPLFLAVPLGLCGLWAAQLGAPNEYLQTASVVMLPFLLATALLTYRRGGAAGMRPPLRLTVATLGMWLFLSCGVTTAAFAYDRLRPSWELRGQLRAANGLRAVIWFHSMSRWSDNEGTSRFVVVGGEAAGGSWTIESPAYRNALSLSPDGRYLLCYDWSAARYVRYDLQERKEEVSPEVLHGFYYGPALWRGASPLLLTNQNDREGRRLPLSEYRLVSWEDGSDAFDLPEDLTHVPQLAGTRMLLRTRRGVSIWDATRPDAPPVDVHSIARLSGDVLNAKLSPDGRFLLASTRTDEGHVAWCTDLERGETVRLQAQPGPGPSDLRWHVRFGTDMRHATISYSWRRPKKSETVPATQHHVVDLRTGVEIALPERATGAVSNVWSPSGRYAVGSVDHRIGVWDLSGEPTFAPLPDNSPAGYAAPALFLDEHRLLCGGLVYDLRSKESVPFEYPEGARMGSGDH